MASNQVAAVEIKPIELQNVLIPISGVSALIMHRWSEKARKQMLDKQMKIASRGKEAKDPEQDVRESLYTDSQGRLVFPAIGFKASIVSAAVAADQKKTHLRQAFHIDAEFVRIYGEATPREDMVRVGLGTADIRFRGEVREWSAVLNVTLNKRMLSVDQLIGLVNAAGFGIGVGEWRPERDGQFGRFEVATGERGQAIVERYMSEAS